MSFIKAAFEEVTRHCVGGERFVTLYQCEQVYGGPEEGGWWRTIITVVQTMKYANADDAYAAFSRISAVAQAKSEASKRQYGERCQSECEWCEARGLDADYLGEPDGPTQFFVAIELTAGEQAVTPSAHYE